MHQDLRVDAFSNTSDNNNIKCQFTLRSVSSDREAISLSAESKLGNEQRNEQTPSRSWCGGREFEMAPGRVLRAKSVAFISPPRSTFCLLLVAFLSLARTLRL